MSEELWYYSRDGKQNGPVPFGELRTLAASSDLRPDDLLWKQGMGEWSSVQEILNPAAPQSPPPLKPATARAEATPPPPLHADRQAPKPGFAERIPRSGHAMPHVRWIENILQRVGAAVSKDALERVDEVVRKIGHLTYALSCLLFALLFATLAIKADSMQLFFMMLFGLLPLSVVGHYVAVKFLDTGARLIPRLPSRIVSDTVFRCTSLLCGGLAAATFVGGCFALIRTNDGAAFSMMCATSAILMYVAMTVLRPESLSIQVVDKADASDEAVGILSFFLKLALRTTPAAFAAVSFASVGVAIYLFFLVFQGLLFNPAVPILGDMTLMDLAVQAVGIGFLPLLAYFGFVISYLLVALCQSILDLPGKATTSKPLPEA